LLRFPITGLNGSANLRRALGRATCCSRYLHKHGYLHWTDNQLTIELERGRRRCVAGPTWTRINEAVPATEFDRTKLGHWGPRRTISWASNVAAATGVEVGGP